MGTPWRVKSREVVTLEMVLVVVDPPYSHESLQLHNPRMSQCWSVRHRWLSKLLSQIIRLLYYVLVKALLDALRSTHNIAYLTKKLFLLMNHFLSKAVFTLVLFVVRNKLWSRVRFVVCLTIVKTESHQNGLTYWNHLFKRVLVRPPVNSGAVCGIKASWPEYVSFYW